jgi:hypothetical protein
MSEDRGKRIVGNVDITNNLTDKRGIKISFYVVEGEDDRASMNKLIDAAMDVVDRQVVRADLVSKRAERSMWIASLELLQRNHEQLMAKRNGARKLTAQENLQVGKFDGDLQRCKLGIESTDAAIAAAEAKLAEV